MSTTRSIKLIKKENRKGPGLQPEAEGLPDPNSWSTEVRSWVVESQQRDRSESLPAFDSLFKDTQL